MTAIREPQYAIRAYAAAMFTHNGMSACLGHGTH